MTLGTPPTSDFILVEGLAVHGILGVNPQERTTPQQIMIDLRVAMPARPADATDAIGTTINYSALANLAATVALDGRFRLVESLAEAIATATLTQFRPTWVQVRVAKPDALPQATAVGIEIVRWSPAAG